MTLLRIHSCTQQEFTKNLEGAVDEGIAAQIARGICPWCGRRPRTGQRQRKHRVGSCTHHCRAHGKNIECRAAGLQRSTPAECCAQHLHEVKGAQGTLDRVLCLSALFSPLIRLFHVSCTPFRLLHASNLCAKASRASAFNAYTPIRLRHLQDSLSLTSKLVFPIGLSDSTIHKHKTCPVAWLRRRSDLQMRGI